MPRDEAFVQFVVQSLCENPGTAIITRSIDDIGVLITLAVEKGDMGRMIGRDGATAKSIRTILRAIGMRNSERVNLKIVQPEAENDTMGKQAMRAAFEEAGVV